MQLFFSYARSDRPHVDALVTRLRQAAGIEIWLDSDLVGGWPWWDKILGQLRSCDAVLVAVSRASVTSPACRSERDYAAKLGKPILPIAVEHVPAGLFPADIARLQIIDYTQPGEAAAFRLAAAIFALPEPKALPNPLPAPPALPQTKFGNLNDLIAAPELSMEQQLGILARLEEALGPTSDQEDRETAAEMLSEMAKRPDLYQAAARKIEALQGEGSSTAPQKSPGPSPGTPPPGKPPETSHRKPEWSPDPWPWSEQPTSPTPPPSQPAVDAKPLFTQPLPSQPAAGTKPPSTQPQQSPPATGTRPLFTQPQPSQPTSTKSVWPEPGQSQPTSTRPVWPEPEQSQPTITRPVWHKPEQSQPTSTLPPQSSTVPSAVAVKAHRAMAIMTAILTVWTIILTPIGIAALKNSSRVNTHSALGNSVGARNASKRVVVAFCIAVAIWIAVIVIGAILASSSNTSTGYTSGIAINHSVVR